MPKKPDMSRIQELVSLAKAAAAEAAAYQERFAAEDTEARKIVDTMERFLRTKGRVVYGGAAINAHLPADKKFYDPTLYLPDYDFMTQDPLQDCADLIRAFQSEGFIEVEAKFGIHEGTYKVFVNFRAAADITYMPPDIYERVLRDSKKIGGIHYASVNFLRMNMYLELSRPAGMVSRWEKVYERLLLLNEEYPLQVGRCADEPLEALAQDKANPIGKRIVTAGIEASAVFLSGASYLVAPHTDPNDDVIIMMSDKAAALVQELVVALNLKPTRYDAMGELLPERTELRTKHRHLVAVIFDTVACHSYTTLPTPKDYRLGSIDLLIQMYYAMYFAELKGYLPGKLLCIIQALIELETSRRVAAISSKGKVEAHDVFPLDCVGHQPTLPELKKAHRDRVKEKKKELLGVVRMKDSFRISRRRRARKA
jgi:hypothetical protein